MPTDRAAASRSFHVVSSIGTPFGESRGTGLALDVAGTQHRSSRHQRRRRLYPVDQSLASARTPPVAVVDRGRDENRQHVVAQDRVVGIGAATRRDRAGEQVGEDRQARALVLADGQQRAAIVEILRVGRRACRACRRSSPPAPARPCSIATISLPSATVDVVMSRMAGSGRPRRARRSPADWSTAAGRCRQRARRAARRTC